MLVSVPSRSTMICGCYVEWFDVNFDTVLKRRRCQRVHWHDLVHTI
jgi:hypothetical protein